MFRGVFYSEINGRRNLLTRDKVAIVGIEKIINRYEREDRKNHTVILSSEVCVLPEVVICQ